MSTKPSPHTPLRADLLLVRQEIMSGNGINIIYPLGREHGISYPGRFPSYDGIALSVFGYIVYPGTVCEFGLKGKSGGFLLLKTNSDEKAVAVAREDGSESLYYGDGSGGYGYGRQFVFRLRAAYDRGLDRRSVKAILTGNVYDVTYNQPMNISELSIHEYFASNGSHVFLSLHVGDFPPAEFPTQTGLDPIIAGVVTMEVGSYAVYEGIYSGSDAIGIKAPGAVRDLGKPQTSGVTVRIGVRKNLTMYVFLPDYGTAPVAAPFSELVTSGHYYIPRFSPNFNVRRVQIETYY
ncbi:uncharacterized protein [Dermacentor albipictus]|uniref:uncharacterized protein n=1 Tax=Dermacentor albipictus TaxID=60249 RepID=UPI0031FDD0B2